MGKILLWEGSMKLTVLLDNMVLPESEASEETALKAEHGSSFCIETDGKKFLFDLGFTDLFATNASKLGFSLADVDAVIFSHHHYDHTGGIRTFLNISPCRQVIAHVDAVLEHSDGENFLKDNRGRFQFAEVRSIPVSLTDNLIFLGEIPSSNDFEVRACWGKVVKGGVAIDDFCLDDSALIFRGAMGVVIITGCSHSGICNIVQYARKVAEQKWGLTKIEAVVGGFHLIEKSQAFLNRVTETLQQIGATNLYPSHCTDLSARIAFARAGLTVHPMGTGTRLEF